VRELAAGATTLGEIAARQSVCRACPRLVTWREQVAAVKRRSFQAEPYWGRPVPGWGAEQPRVLIVGLAPAAHGGNRTGRIFTGDRSGDFLFASLYRCGLAKSPLSVSAGDGQELIGTRIVAAVACAPPENKPTPQERDTCAPWLVAELSLAAASLRTIVCLGGFAWQALWPALRMAGLEPPRPRPAFAHGAEAQLRRQGPGGTRPGGTCPGGTGPGRTDAGEADPGEADPGEADPGRAGTAGAGPVLLIGCYHPSQQNTFTGRVTGDMLDAIFSRAREYAGR
jgi:uracil-DNA glycosylase family 4